MKRRTRQILFFAFLGAFLLTAPVVVLYTAGYRYNFSTRQITQTGVFSVGSAPKGASVFVDGTSSGATTPSLIKNVFPGEHTLTVSKNGYSTWKKTLGVESRATTFADDIVLFMDGDSVLLRETDLRAVSINPQGTKASFVETTGQWTEVWIHSLGAASEILVSRIPVGKSASIQFDWAREGGILSMTSTEDGRSTITRVYPETGEPVLVPTVSDVVLSPVADHVAVARTNGDAGEILAYVPMGDYSVTSSPSGLIQLEDTARHRLILVQSSGGDRPILLNADAIFWQWESNGSRLLYTDGFDLHVYDASSHSDETITRLSSPVTWVGWYPGHSYVLYAQDNAIYATELDRRGDRNVTRLAEGSDLRAFGTSANGATLWFFGTVGGKSGLFERRLGK